MIGNIDDESIAFTRRALLALFVMTPPAKPRRDSHRILHGSAALAGGAFRPGGGSTGFQKRHRGAFRYRLAISPAEPSHEQVPRPSANPRHPVFLEHAEEILIGS